jgi:hypothetical protein
MARNPLKKGFLQELDADIQVFPSGIPNFRMETNWIKIQVGNKGSRAGAATRIDLLYRPRGIPWM